MDKRVHIIKSDTDYAMRMLVYLAMNGDAGPVSAAVLVKRQKIPMDFAYKILQKLGRANIVKSFKGPKGGFCLAQESQQITLLDVTETVQGPLVIRPCILDDDACPMRPTCPITARLKQLQKGLRESIQNLTLAEIVKAKTGGIKKRHKNNPKKRNNKPVI
jgi:Rrf2 family iron-sulfur cluster assembly transcriptional regulator